MCLHWHGRCLGFKVQGSGFKVSGFKVPVGGPYKEEHCIWGSMLGVTC